jgi:pimeloyl-ACP methyl ester carboxylesterase
VTDRDASGRLPAMLDPKPFEVRISDAEATDLRDRLTCTRWPDAETVDDWSQGIPLEYVREVCAYWADEYDLQAAEARFNAFPQFIADVDGMPIHFLHVRSPEPGALPLVMTHGWPGSVVEFHEVIGPLTDPVAHGGQADDAFHLVCPSLPGYGWSGKPTTSGWGVERIASTWAALMAGLGYEHYGAQGGDWGASVTREVGMLDRDHVVGIHLNMVIAAPDPETMNDLTPAEQAALESLDFYSKWDSGYSKQQSTRPQTVGYGLVDSPAAQCAWILEKFHAWSDCDGHPENVYARDRLLDNVMTYWLPATGASSARLYWESFNRVRFDPVDVPTGGSVFPKEIFRPSRRWAEKQFTDLRYWGEPERGGHFAAFERPNLFVDEVRAAFRTMR